MKIKKVVLVCDGCETVMPEDEPIDALGVDIPAIMFHHESGGQPFRKLYFCLTCTNHRTLGDLLRICMAREEDKR